MIQPWSTLIGYHTRANEIVYSGVAHWGSGGIFQLNPDVFNIPNMQLS